MACGEVIDANPLQRSLIACYAEHGIDAVPLEGGAVHFDREGTLTKEESFRLANLYGKRVEAMGLSPLEMLTGPELAARYAKLEEVRECLQSLGFEIPALNSFEDFMADPTGQPHPYDHLDSESGDLERGMTACPDSIQMSIKP